MITVKFLGYLGRYFNSGHNVVEEPVTQRNPNFVVELIFVPQNSHISNRTNRSDNPSRQLSQFIYKES